MRLLHHCARTMSAFMAAASLVALIGTPCSADVPPPPPPPSPSPGLGTSGGQQAARDLRTGTAPSNRILLTLGNEDTVVVDPTVQLSGVGNVVEIPAPASALRYALASGDTLRVDGSTPPGAYELADGRRVTLGAALGYPRIYTISPKPHYAQGCSWPRVSRWPSPRGMTARWRRRSAPCANTAPRGSGTASPWPSPSRETGIGTRGSSCRTRWLTTACCSSAMAHRALRQA